MNSYPTNLTDNQWQITERFVDVQARKRKHPLRSVFDAISYLLKSGCQWRMLPKKFTLLLKILFVVNEEITVIALVILINECSISIRVINWVLKYPNLRLF